MGPEVVVLPAPAIAQALGFSHRGESGVPASGVTRGDQPRRSRG